MGQQSARLVLETVPVGDGTGLRFRATPESGHDIVMDSGPAAVAPTPVEVVLAALGGCAGMDVISILRKMRQDVTGYDIELVGDRRDEHPRAFTAIEVLHRIRGRNVDPAAVARAIQLSEERYCSVQAMLAPAVRLASRFEIVDEGAPVATPGSGRAVPG